MKRLPSYLHYAIILILYNMIVLLNLGQWLSVSSKLPTLNNELLVKSTISHGLGDTETPSFFNMRFGLFTTCDYGVWDRSRL